MSDWIMREDGALCLAGYPIRIKRGAELPFDLESDWHKRRFSYGTLDIAKRDGERWAKEIDAFDPEKQVMDR